MTTVLCAVRGPAETEVVQALSSTPGLELTRRCADLAETLAAAAAGRGSVVVLSADHTGLDREAVRHLHGSGAWVVVVVDPRRPEARALGADLVLPVEDVARTGERVLALLAATERDGRGPGAVVPADPLAVRLGGGVEGRNLDTVPLGEETGHRGALVAVWGPTGAPGRTTVAVNLADAWAARGTDTLLVDLDTYGGAVGPLLGVLDEAPGVAAVARAAATGPVGPFELAALSPALPGGLRVLTGISRADRWPEVTVTGTEAILDAARRLTDVTVVDTGFCLERDEELSYDTRAPRRNQATTTVLEAADVVVVVGTADPVGLQRLVRGLGELEDLGVPAGRRCVVVNRVRATAAGPRPGEAVRHALQRYAGVSVVHLLPEDREACDDAVLAGRTLREQVPGSAIHRAIDALAGTVLARDAVAGAH